MKTFNYTTHSKQVLGDMHTPVSIYLKVRDMYPQFRLSRRRKFTVIHRPLSTGKYRYEQWYSHSQLSGQ